jgi:hypothetical protein
MGKINVGRVFLGGIVAGLVINVMEGVLHGLVLANRDTDMLKNLGLPPGGSTNEIIALNLWGFAVGILTVWTYAAIRPRMGAGPKTAACAGLFVWAGVSLLGAAVPTILGIYHLDLTAVNVICELVMFVLAGIAGGAVYKEDSANRSAAAGA